MKAKTIVITSGKGGVGKTTTTANLGAALALRGHKVVCIDTDIGLRNLDVVMGLENRIVYDLINVIEGKCKLQQALIRDKQVENLYLIPASQSREKDCIGPGQLKGLCKKLSQDFDYILVDCPAGIEQGFKNAVGAAQEAIIVTTPEVAAIRDADRVIGLVEAAELPRPRLIINRINGDMVKRGDMMDKKDITDLLAVDILGLVPLDEKLIVATNRGVPVVHDKKSAAGAEYLRIAARLDGEEVPLEDVQPSRNGLLDKVKGIIGINRSAYSHA